MSLKGRWTLDDVERISRGKSSKAKMGSRQVPHRLSAEERKVHFPSTSGNCGLLQKKPVMS